MILQLDVKTHTTLDNVRRFLLGNPQGTVLAPQRKQADARLERVLRRFAKTDRIDAAMLARFGCLRSLEPTPPLEPSLANLKDLVLVRRRFVDERASLGKLESELGCKRARHQLRLARAEVERRLNALDEAIVAALAADPALQRRAEVLQSTPSIRPVNAASLVAPMPELGTLGRRASGTLPGVAPSPRGSGQRQGWHPAKTGIRAASDPRGLRAGDVEQRAREAALGRESGALETWPG